MKWLARATKIAPLPVPVRLCAGRAWRQGQPGQRRRCQASVAAGESFGSPSSPISARPRAASSRGDGTRADRRPPIAHTNWRAACSLKLRHEQPVCLTASGRPHESAPLSGHLGVRPRRLSPVNRWMPSSPAPCVRGVGSAAASACGSCAVQCNQVVTSPLPGSMRRTAPSVRTYRKPSVALQKSFTSLMCAWPRPPSAGGRWLPGALRHQ